MTWSQLGRHEKPIVIANLNGFWEPFSRLVDHMKSEGFIHRSDSVRPITADTIADIAPAIEGALRPKAAEGRPEIIDSL